MLWYSNGTDNDDDDDDNNNNNNNNYTLWALDKGVNSRRPLNRLQYVFALCDPVTLTF